MTANDWKNELGKQLRAGMKYCFPCVDGKYPEVVDEAFSGTEDEPGFLDHMISLVLALRKRAYFAGYWAGVQDAVKDCGVSVVGTDEGISRIGAERRWNEMEGEKGA